MAAWTLAWAWMVEQGRAPALPKATPTPLIEENHWRARRHGASAKLIDWPTDSELPLQQALQVEAEVLAPALQHLGLRERFGEMVKRELRLRKKQFEKIDADRERLLAAQVVDSM